MHASADRLDFAPPAQPGMVRAFVLAIIAHVLLMLALTWGITWNKQTENLAAEAELWSSVPQEAAPQAAAPPQVVQAPPLQAPPPPPPPVEKAAPPPPPPPAAVKQPDIALEREKQKQELARDRREELEREKKLEAKRKQEEDRREQALAKKEEQKRERLARKEEQRLDQLAAKKEAEARRKQEELANAAKTKKQQLDDEKRVAASRAAQLDRMRKLAGATGSGAPDAAGIAARSSGPSAGYAGRVVARVRPNIVFTDDIAGSPTAEVEVRTSPDGTIVSRRIIKSSGVPSWDNAVLRALDKTEVLPRDTDGRVPTPMILEFKPRS